MLEALRQIGVRDQQLGDMPSIQRLLRVRRVEEWTNNTDFYQGFLTVDLHSAAQEFLTSGHFAGSAGDLMALTLSNVLGSRLVFKKGDKQDPKTYRSISVQEAE